MSQSAIPGSVQTQNARRASVGRLLLAPLSALVGVLVWEAIVRLRHYPPFILPLPAQVWERFLTVLRDGTLLSHGWVTLEEVLAGLGLGVLAASLLGYWIARWPWLDSVLTPYLVASQAVPIVAIAPLLVIWLGTGPVSKIAICALVTFFPILINIILGLRSVEPALRDLMRSLQATSWQMFQKLELPAAMPALLTGLKVGATLSVIGAVVGEFVGADRGLGFLISLGRGQYDTALVLVVAAVLAALALGLYGLVALLEHLWLAGERADKVRP